MATGHIPVRYFQHIEEQAEIDIMRIQGSDILIGFILFTVFTILTTIVSGTPAVGLAVTIGGTFLSFFTFIAALVRRTLEGLAAPVRNREQAVRNPAHNKAPFALIALYTITFVVGVYLLNHWLDGIQVTIAGTVETIMITVSTIAVLVVFEKLNTM